MSILRTLLALPVACLFALVTRESIFWAINVDLIQLLKPSCEMTLKHELTHLVYALQYLQCIFLEVEVSMAICEVLPNFNVKGKSALPHNCISSWLAQTT